MCCLALVAVISPRLAIVLLWLFTDRVSVAFSSFWIALLGFLLLPWTTLAWLVVFTPVFGVQGFGWFIVIIAFIADLATWAGSFRSNRTRTA